MLQRRALVAQIRRSAIFLLGKIIEKGLQCLFTGQASIRWRPVAFAVQPNAECTRAPLNFPAPEVIITLAFDHHKIVAQESSIPGTNSASHRCSLICSTALAMAAVASLVGAGLPAP
jgi:hypothetical protein